MFLACFVICQRVSFHFFIFSLSEDDVLRSIITSTEEFNKFKKQLSQKSPYKGEKSSNIKHQEQMKAYEIIKD